MSDPLPTALGARLQEIIDRIIKTPNHNPHFRAVQAQCTSARQIFKGILTLAADDNGLATDALMRTLLETCVSTVILAKHAEKLPDFVEHAKLTSMKIRRSITTVPRPDASQDYGPEIAALEKKFRPSGNWHFMKTTDSFEAAGFSPELRRNYYIRASAIAHGEPYSVVRHDTTLMQYRIGVDWDWWNGMVQAAYVQSCLMMASLADTINHIFALGMEGDIEPIGKAVLDYMSQEIKRMNERFESAHS